MDGGDISLHDFHLYESIVLGGIGAISLVELF